MKGKKKWLIAGLAALLAAIGVVRPDIGVLVQPVAGALLDGIPPLAASSAS